MRRAGWAAIVMGVGFMATTALAMIFAPRALLSIYVDVDASRNAVLIGYALQYLVIAAAFQLFDGMQAVAAGALRGLQDTRIPMWIAIFAYWVPGFGAAIVLGFETPLEGTGVWIGLATGLVFSALLLIWRWIARDRIGLTDRPASIAS
jgi:MATE family multidrug resistance protein